MLHVTGAAGKEWDPGHHMQASCDLSIHHEVEQLTWEIIQGYVTIPCCWQKVESGYSDDERSTNKRSGSKETSI